MKSRVPTSLLMAAITALALTACGGAGASDTTEQPATREQPATTGQPATTEQPSTTEQPDTTEAADEGSSDADAAADDSWEEELDGLDDLAGLSPECIEASEGMAAALSSYSTGIAGAMTGDLGGSDLEDAAGQLQAMADAAPDEIKDDLEVIAAELGSFYEAMAEAGFSGDQIPTAEQMEELTRLAESMDQDAFEEATANIDAWFSEHCES